MTTKNDALGLVIDLACLTEDRAPDEQRAMIEVALRLDCDLGAFTVTNRERMQAPRYLKRVCGTYNPSEGRTVRPTTQEARRYETLDQRWRLCTECKLPMGGHGPDRCPDRPIDITTLRAAVER